jgi:biopolymer transport protein TolR
MIKIGPSRQPMADINVTPLVDVTLVLLIIFMVTAPFLQSGLELQLPKVAARGLEAKEGLVVSVQVDRTVAVGKTIVGIDRFERALQENGATRRPVYLRADARVPYGTVVDLMARMRRVGVSQLSVVTETPPRER